MTVAVVGAGVVGLACAWELARAGADVLVLDAGTAGGGVSRGNAGWICPTITAPLPAPGMVREGLRQLVTRGGAFTLRPHADPTFAHWLWTFRRNCTLPRYEAGTRALLALNRRTMELYDRYRAGGLAFEMHDTGLVLAARTRAGLAPYLRLARLVAQLGYDGRIDELDGREAARVEPALDENAVECALHAHEGRYVRPEELTAALVASVRELGAEVRERIRVSALRQANGGWVLSTSTGSSGLGADKVVVAAGLGSPALLREHGVRLPLIGARGYSVMVAGEGVPPAHALYLTEAKLALSAYSAGVRVAGVLELGARGTTPPAGAGARLVAAARPYLRGWRPADSPEATWAGLRPASADGLPLIGAVPGRAGLYVATGHTMSGVALAPATAAALAPLVLHGERPPELEPFDPGRLP
jgi:D-amino-acid dehydrogenase